MSEVKKELIKELKERIFNKISSGDYNIYQELEEYMSLYYSGKVFCICCEDRGNYYIEKSLKNYNGTIYPSYTCRCTVCFVEIPVGLIEDINHFIHYSACKKTYEKEHHIISTDQIAEIPYKYQISLDNLRVITSIKDFGYYLDGMFVMERDANVLELIYNNPIYYLFLLKCHKNELSLEEYNRSLNAALSIIRKKKVPKLLVKSNLN